MPKFRKKPVVIEAVQLHRMDSEVYRAGWPRWLNDAWEKPAGALGAVWPSGDGGHAVEVGTLEGNHRAAWGDFIIRGVRGELYPCKPDIFAATYDRVED
jgi:hypothetical protein